MDVLIKQYRASFPDKARTLEAALKSGDLAALTTLIHRLAGSSGSYGFETLSELCQNTENQIQLEQTIPNDLVQAIIDHLHSLSDSN